MKRVWISTRGPLVSAMTVYEDFFSYNTEIYHYVSGAQIGGHCICVVGYDDTNQESAPQPNTAARQTHRPSE